MSAKLIWCVVPLAGAVALLCIARAPVVAQDDQRLLEQEPFDRVVFKEPSNRVIKVLPLDLPPRRVPSDPASTDKLRVRPWDNPAEPYEIPWRLIERVDVFDQLLLEEAEALTAAGHLGEAYDYLAHLERYAPNLPGRETAFERFLYTDAQASLQKNDFELALASLYELYERNPDFDGVGAALTQAISARVDVLMSEKQYATVNQFLEAAIERIGETDATLDWRSRLEKMAGELLDEGRRRFQAGQVNDGRELLRQTLLLRPNHQGARQLMADVHRQHPEVVIGVTQSSAAPGNSFLYDWAWRRANRLLYRRLFEPVGFGPEGGTYESPIAEVERRGFGLELSFTLESGIAQSNRSPTLTGYDLSHHLRKMTDPAGGLFEPAWAELLESVDVQDVYRVDVKLNRGHVLPAALLQSVVVPKNAADVAGDELPQNGPFRVASRSSSEVIYDADPNYFALTATQPLTIVERFYPDSASAVRALEQGEVSALDRVDLRYLDRLNENQQIIVDAYAAPTVHCLIPTRRNPLMANRALRRALIYAIPRQQILQSVLLGGRELPGCQVISGPFPVGYAYDDRIEPRPYDPRLAMSLIEVAFFQETAAQRASDPASEVSDERSAEGESKVLVLVHPASEPARSACQAIQAALKRVGLEVTLEPFDSYASLQAENYDLVYAELAMWEPLADARRLFRPSGLLGHVSPYLEVALRRLDEVNDLREARERLMVVHRFAHQDVTVVPLWQIREHYARHRSLEGVGNQPVTLYQNVEAWKSTPPVLWGLE